ncbi:MAG: arginine--tRNA ligase [Desulforhabdus sp.]|jgi:arginyl-tRNA synthetase|nr:arginine--tRNA ligase [Desulforhabdus sp.]
MALVRNRILEALSGAILPLLKTSEQAGALALAIELEIPKASQHGDYASNIALSLTRPLRRNPREIAKEIIQNLKSTEDIIERVEIAGPGFLNFFVHPHAWHRVLKEIHARDENYGRQNIGRGKRVQVEFVSANPTGPLHIGHGRGAATGDALAAIFSACGYAVDREYYINDAGNQMETLGRSLYYRYQQELGESVEFPDGHYQGDYMRDLARELIAEVGDRYRETPLDEILAELSRFAGERILAGIKEDLDIFGVSFDQWFSEQSLHNEDAIEKTIDALEARGYIYQEEGARWFRSTAFGDEKDRVVIRANGLSTYFASDLAYHKNKFERGFDIVVDIWGADHHGYVERMLAGVEALGRKRSDLQIILVQLVNLLRAGKPVAMSTRAGEFVTLREVIDEVGRDAARFIFLTRRSDSPLDFDLEVAKTQSNDNPVYYVQYAHARLCSIFEVAVERRIACEWLAGGSAPRLEMLVLPQELALIKMLGEYPEILASSVRCLEPHRIPYYLNELVSLFHSYYNQNRILGDDPDLTQARLYLAAATRLVIGNALKLLGVSAPQKM